MAESNQTINIAEIANGSKTEFIKVDQSLSKYEEYFKGFSDIGIKLDDLVKSLNII